MLAVAMTAVQLRAGVVEARLSAASSPNEGGFDPPLERFSPDASTNSNLTSTNSSSGFDSNSSVGSPTPDIACKEPPAGYACLSVVLPTSGTTYLAGADVGGAVVTTSEQVEVETDVATSISVYSLASGYAFSFWGTSPSEISVAQFELGSTTIDVTGASALYLNVYQSDSGAEVYFEVLYHNVTAGSSAGQLLLENHAFVIGQYAWLTDGQAYSISAQGFGSGFSFSQWATQVGTIGNLTTESTTFSPFEGGTLALLVSYESNWGGYVESNLDVTAAEGVFTLPSSFAEQSGAIQYIGFWVGIGGVASYGSNLWQAGVVIMWGDDSLTIEPFWEEIGPGCPDCSATFGTEQAHPGDKILIKVTSSGGTNFFEVDDESAGWSYDNTVLDFTPNSQSAEWIGECSNCGSGTEMYAFASVEVSSPMVDDQAITFAGSVGATWVAFEVGGISPTYVIDNSNYEEFHLIPSSLRVGFG